MIRRERATGVLADVLSLEADLPELVRDLGSNRRIHAAGEVRESLVAVHLLKQIFFRNGIAELGVDSGGDLGEAIADFRRLLVTLGALLDALRARFLEFLAYSHRLESQRLGFHGEREGVSVAIGYRAAYGRIDLRRGSLIRRFRSQARRIDSLNPQELQCRNGERTTHGDTTDSLTKRK